MLVAAIASCLTTIGVCLVLIQLRQSQRQRHRQFEDLYLQRYWTLLDRMPTTCEPLLTDVHSDPGDEERLRWILTYLQLCEDQAEMRAQGWVTDQTWRQWADGIGSKIKEWPCAPAWRRFSANPTGFRYLRSFEANGFAATYDPLVMKGWHRHVRGLTGPSDGLGEPAEVVEWDPVEPGRRSEHLAPHRQCEQEPPPTMARRL
jgi:hypothetical protein